MAPRSLFPATLVCALLSAIAIAQEAPSAAPSHVPLTCFPPGVVKNADVLGRTIARGITHDCSSVFEMLKAPNGWLLIVRTQQEFCIVAAGKDLAQPSNE